MIDPLPNPLSPELPRRMHGYWRASGFLAVGRIHLRDSAILEHGQDLPEFRDRRWQA